MTILDYDSSELAFFETEPITSNFSLASNGPALTLNAEGTWSNVDFTYFVMENIVVEEQYDYQEPIQIKGDPVKPNSRFDF